MKAALNGCLNLSVLDGWWDEWYQPDFGWAVPTADGAGTDPDHRDDVEAAALYDLLEQRVAPRFYERGRTGLPDRWIEMVRRTLALLGPKVLAGRMVREYVERLYTPAAHAHRALGPEAARELAAWKARVRGAWQEVTVDHVETIAGPPTAELGSTLGLRVRVGLGGLGPEDIEVQAVSGRVDEEDRIEDATAVPLKPAGAPDADGRWVYEGPLALDRTGPYGYTVRILPAHRLLASGAEMGLMTVPSEGATEEAGVLLR
jgi:starch phosphorylase